MANSIKLSGDKYWDTSGLHGGQILNALPTLSTQTSKTYNVPNGFRGLLFIFLGSNSAMGMYMVYSTSTGATYICPINEVTSNVTVTTGTNSLTINNQLGGSCFPFFMGNGLITT